MWSVITYPDCVYHYVLVAVDGYSKYTILEPLKNKMGSSLAQTLLDRIFLMTDILGQIYMDAELEFANTATHQASPSQHDVWVLRLARRRR